MGHFTSCFYRASASTRLIWLAVVVISTCVLVLCRHTLVDRLCISVLSLLVAMAALVDMHTRIIPNDLMAAGVVLWAVQQGFYALYAPSFELLATCGTQILLSVLMIVSLLAAERLACSIRSMRVRSMRVRKTISHLRMHTREEQSLQLIGRGDMKLLALLCLWLPAPSILQLLICASAFGCVSACLLRSRYFPWAPAIYCSWLLSSIFPLEQLIF